MNNSNLHQVLVAHWLNPEQLESNQFAERFVQRGEAMRALISHAMGKPVTGGRETFWSALRSARLAPETTAAAPDELEAELFDDDPEHDDLGESAYLVEQHAADD